MFRHLFKSKIIWLDFLIVIGLCVLQFSFATHASATPHDINSISQSHGNEISRNFIVEFTGEPDTAEALEHIYRFRAIANHYQLPLREKYAYSRVFSGVSVQQVEDNEGNEQFYDGVAGVRQFVETLPFVKRVWESKGYQTSLKNHNITPHTASSNHDVNSSFMIRGNRKETIKVKRADFSSGKLTSPSGILPKDIHKLTGVDKLHNELGLTGKGIKVGIIDTGVDYMHPELGGCFKTPGCPFQYGYDFIGGDGLPKENHEITVAGDGDHDPQDPCVGHGTHVAGIIAGKGPLVYGVAPNVTMGIYRVSGCLPKGISNDDIIAALEMAYNDEMDVVNISLSGGGWREGPTSIAAENLIKKGMLVVAADSNDGEHGLYTSGMPAVGKGVLNVGSYESPYMVGDGLDIISVERNFTISQFIGNISYPFKPKDGPVELVMGITNSGDDKDSDNLNLEDSFYDNPAFQGCFGFPSTLDLKGKAVLLARGGCTFLDKAYNVQNAGAMAVIVANNEKESVLPLISDAIKIPYIITTKDHGQLLADTLKTNKKVYISPSNSPLVIENPVSNKISTFSSWGPDPELYIAPGIMAPGGQIFSTVPRVLGNYTMMSGTSMSTPYMTGVIALMLEARMGKQGIKPEVLRDLLINHAKPIKSETNSEYLTTPLRQGSGYVNAYGSVKSSILAYPTSLALNYSLTNDDRVTKSLTLVNLHETDSFAISLNHKASESVTAYYPNGTFTMKPITDTGGSARVDIENQQLIIPPQQSREVNITISSPKHLDNKDGHWYYGGYITMTAAKENTSHTKVVEAETVEELNVPYMGYIGDYHELPYFSIQKDQLPILFSNITNMPIVEEGQKVSLNGTDSLVLMFPSLRPTKLLTIQLIEADTKTSVGYLPLGYTPYMSYTGLPPSPVLKTVINGVIFKPTSSSSFYSPITSPKFEVFGPGVYQAKVSALKMFGDLDNPDDYEVWVSPTFNVTSVVVNPEMLKHNDNITAF
ncbi:hypothetical protein H4219_005141 [Mycoemilia scoparia]|uniref:Peptidase S8/S53 domain-containing protein n=1 Tax=Mycoemilia scoparia TaxID=417184 RepID=A0A9W7ZYR7_9FUNG|nr:hypothetical protein H4219_005141 [Mycoemilia scoparia]